MAKVQAFSGEAVPWVEGLTIGQAFARQLGVFRNRTPVFSAIRWSG